MREHTKTENACPYCGFDLRNYERNSRWLPPGYVLNGKYMIGKVLGEGGFGVTYVGWDQILEVRVAVKEYFPIGMASRTVMEHGHYSLSVLMGENEDGYRHGLERFMEEARSLSRFDHLKGIVSVKDFFFENRTAYMVMEFVEGETLKQFLNVRGGRLETETALELMRPVLQALEVVHRAGIIHRDISPDNIMITPSGDAKLIDFGAARMTGNNRSRTFTIVLKQGYAPPEQYQSAGRQGPWTDIYAVSAVLYRMISGETPPSAVERLTKDNLQTLSQLGCSVPDALNNVIKKGLAIQLRQRYQNVEEMYEDLYRKSRSRGFTFYGKLAGVLAVLLLTVSAVFFVFRKPAETTVPDIAEADITARAEPDIEAGAEPEAEKSEETKAEPEPEPADLLPLITAAAAEGETFSASGYHFVTVEDGKVTGRGTNDYGMLDFGSSVWEGAVSISSGQTHTVGVKADHTVVAVGDQSGGKCGVETWKDVVQASAGENHTLGCREDGTVLGAGNNDYGQLEVSDWTDMEYVAAGANHSLGLSDGRVTAVGDNSCGQCQVNTWSGIAVIDACKDVSAGLTEEGNVVLAGNIVENMKKALEWTQIIDISLSDGYIAGLRRDGEILLAGTYEDQMKGWNHISAIETSEDSLIVKTEGQIIFQGIHHPGTSPGQMKNLKKAASGDNFLIGLKEDGTVLLYSTAPDTQGMDKVRSWAGLKDISASGTTAAGLLEDGTVAVAGGAFEKVKEWQQIQNIMVVDNLIYGVTEDGRVLAAGDDSSEQCLYDTVHVGKLCESRKENKFVLLEDGTVCMGESRIDGLYRENSRITELVYWGRSNLSALYEDGKAGIYDGISREMLDWKGITQIAAGKEHMIGRKEDGTVVATGSNANGQCEVSGWTDVAAVFAGDFQSYGITSDGVLLIAGCLPGQY